MKKIYAAILLGLISIGAYAQCTPDNSLTQPGYLPNELDTAFVGQNYEMVVHIRIPKDTSVVFFGQNITADIDSIRLVSVEGLPQNLTYQCNVANCLFTPTQTYCARISGTPTANDIGTRQLRFAIVAYASAVIIGTRTNLPPQQDTLDQFELIVANSSGGTNNLTEVKDDNLFSVYPNPAQQEFNILLNGFDSETIHFEITDITGKIFAKNTLLLHGNTEVITIPSKNWAAGIYFVRVQNSKGIFTQRLVIEN